MEETEEEKRKREEWERTHLNQGNNQQKYTDKPIDGEAPPAYADLM
jgi:hypothetical protein